MPARSRNPKLIAPLLYFGVVFFTLVAARLLTSASPTLGLAAAFGVVLFIICFLSAEASLYILIFSMLLSPEFGQRTTAGGGVTLRLDDFLLVVITFAWLARAAIYKELGLFPKTAINRGIILYLLASAIATGLGMMAGRVRPTVGFFFLLKYFQYFVVFFMMVNNLRSSRQIRNFTYAVIITALIVSLIAMAQIPAGGRVTTPFEGQSGEPNTLGGYLVLIISILMGLFLTTDAEDKYSYKGLLLGLILLFAIPVIFSQSRGSWLAVIPMYFTFLILGKKKAVMTIIMIFGLLFGPMFMPKAITERIAYTFERQRGFAALGQQKIGGVTLDTSSSARLASWREALSDFATHPVIGYGITGWRFTDNQFVRLLIETGLIGLSSFLFMIWLLLREAWRTYRTVEDKFHRGLAFGFFAGIIAMLTHSIGANTFILVRIMEPFWLIAAMVLMMRNIELAEKGEAERVEVAPAAVKATRVGLRL